VGSPFYLLRTVPGLTTAVSYRTPAIPRDSTFPLLPCVLPLRGHVGRFTVAVCSPGQLVPTPTTTTELVEHSHADVPPVHTLDHPHHSHHLQRTACTAPQRYEWTLVRSDRWTDRLVGPYTTAYALPTGTHHTTRFRPDFHWFLHTTPWCSGWAWALLLPRPTGVRTPPPRCNDHLHIVGDTVDPHRTTLGSSGGGRPPTAVAPPTLPFLPVGGTFRTRVITAER